MGMLEVLHWLRGYSQVCAPGKDAGKLMTLCARNGILLWQAQHQSNVFYGRVHSRLFPNLQALAEQTGVEVRVLKEKGLPVLLRQYHKRVGILCGLFVFCISLAVSQQFIWKIEIEGCEKVEEARLMTVLDEAGVRRGALKRNIDQRHAAREVLIKVDELSWTAINFHGTTAILKLRERTPPPPKIDTDIPANVVALEDGQIKKLQVTDGKAVLKEGDTVRKGEVIISGVWQDRWGLTHFVRAGGQAYAHVPRSLVVKMPLVQEQYSITRLEKRSYAVLFGWKVPLFFARELEGEYKVERFSETPTFFGVSLPFSIERENILFYDKQEAVISPEMALSLAQRRLAVLEENAFRDKTILSRNVSATEEEGVLVLRCEYEMEMDIAKRQDITVLEYRTPEEKRKIPREGGY